MSREEQAFLAASLVVYGENMDSQIKEAEKKTRR